ncbi:hypothetical protein CDL15_Pgr026292 [Punica granatum]|nr:hypothetical protein CDL15_Pgr026292 [Punica granatum]
MRRLHRQSKCHYRPTMPLASPHLMATNMAEMMALLRGPNRTSSNSTPPLARGSTADPAPWALLTLAPEGDTAAAASTTPVHQSAHAPVTHPIDFSRPQPTIPVITSLPPMTIPVPDPITFAPPPLSVPAPATIYTMPPPTVFPAPSVHAPAPAQTVEPFPFPTL